LILENGEGIVWKGDAPGIQEENEGSLFESTLANSTETSERTAIKLKDTRKLSIATLRHSSTAPADSSVYSIYRKLVFKLFFPRCCPQSSFGRPAETLE